VHRSKNSSLAKAGQHASEHESIPARLQRITHAAHTRINQHPMLAGLTKLGYPLRRYTNLLARYFHIYTSIERSIEQCIAGTALSLGYNKKLPWLINDLQYFGIDPEDPEHYPSCPLAFPLPANCGSLIGTLYAVEGATLGGQVISRHLRETLALTSTTGACFFNGYGDALETRRRWEEFGNVADSLIVTPEQRQLADESALAVFELIERQLDDCHAQPER